MADFCKQCTELTFGPDCKNDFAYLYEEATPEEKDNVDNKEMGWPVLCEGCGPIMVGKEGECLSTDCFEKHNVKSISDSGG